MMNKISLSALSALLSEKKSTLIFCHKNPDPDTLGSAFALKCILEHYGSSVRVAGCDEASAKFSFITGGARLTDKLSIDSYERVIAIDVGSANQLGNYSCYAERVNLIIDHHEMNARFADYYEDFTPACAMIVYDIACELGIVDALPLHFFECVYAGLSGDTGCFKYSNTTPRALVMASELIKRDIDFAEINRIIFDSKTVTEIAAQRMAYEHMELSFDGAVAIISVTNKMKQDYKISDEDISDIVNSVRQIQGVLVAVSIKQSSTDDKKFSVSTRANIDIDVSKICATLGGGGHPRAAGATVADTDLDALTDKIKELLAKEISAYGK